ncbi:MAG: hypothetical protein EZS28_021300 [Streblomastix strix]|uniref:Uncharacterized protein n=1 Tax=Streblomastix strix TaxID=222440 RepID=A0A5J4VLS0_9EUKA|nr:MAG: hypothetical protein EZS28_021300 [Streblomastix strix]
MSGEETRRPSRLDSIDGQILSLSMSSAESFGQFALNLKNQGLSDDDQVSVLQQMIIFTSRSIDNMRSAFECVAIDTISDLLAHSQNIFVKQMSMALIVMLSQHGGSNEEEVDYTGVSILLSKFLFSPNPIVSTTGKTSLINLMKCHEGIVHDLLQIGLLDSSAESLMIIPLSSSQKQSQTLSMISSSSQISSSSPYSVFVMNILEVLDREMVIETDLEKLRMIPWIEMSKDLLKPIGMGKEGPIDLQRQIQICQYLIEMLENEEKNDEYRNGCIQSGIAKALLNIFQNWKLEDIKEQYSIAFLYLTFTSNNEINQLLFAQQPFKGLLSLLNHPDKNIQYRGIKSIFNIQLGAANTTLDTQAHPYFDAVASIGGIENIYEFMNRRHSDKDSKDRAVIIIGYLFQSREIEKADMRINVIKHLKSLVSDKVFIIIFISVNKEEIEKDGFVIPE